jgi:hypothetical protein
MKNFTMFTVSQTEFGWLDQGEQLGRAYDSLWTEEKCIEGFGEET